MRQYLEDFAAGDELTSHGRTIGEADFLAWAGIEHDFAGIHFDGQLMADSAFGERIAAGFIAMNLAVGMFGQGEWDFYWPEGALRTDGWQGVRFLKPVFMGDTIRTRRRISSVVADRDDSGVVTHEVTVLNQRDEPVLEGIETVRIRLRPTAGAAR